MNTATKRTARAKTSNPGAWWLRAGAATLSLTGAAGIALAASTASAVPAGTPRFVEGNVTTCDEAGLSGDVLFGSSPDYPQNPTAGFGVVSADGTELDVTINSGFTASGIVVKGGPDTNVYDGPFVGPIIVEDMTSPPNPGGNIPQISHWFVCGETTPPPTTPPPTTPPPTTPPPTTPPPTTPPPTTPPPTTPPPPTPPPTTPPPTTPPPTTPPTTPPTMITPTGAPDTGAGGGSARELSGVGSLALAGGTALLLLGMRRRRDSV